MNVIRRLRRLSRTPQDPRQLSEWPVPVLPSELKVLLSHLDGAYRDVERRKKALEDVEASNETLPLVIY